MREKARVGENYYCKIYFSDEKLLLPLCRRANTCFNWLRWLGTRSCDVEPFFSDIMVIS